MSLASIIKSNKYSIKEIMFEGKNIYSHSLFVTNIQSLDFSGIYVCANTRDIKNVPLNFYRFKKYRLI